jgi:hypothetical protein
MKESCQAKDWYPIFREVYHERTWEEWNENFCNDKSNQYLRCCFYYAKVFFNPSKRSFQSKEIKEVIRILEGNLRREEINAKARR